MVSRGYVLQLSNNPYFGLIFLQTISSVIHSLLSATASGVRDGHDSTPEFAYS